MMYEIEKNPSMKCKKVDMVCDEKLCNDFNPSIESLNTSFNMILVGRPGSGKTNFMINLIKGSRKNGERKGLKKLFHNIIVCSPSIASLKNNIFKGIDESKMFEDFNLDFINFVQEITEIDSAAGLKTLVICDDVGTQLRKDANVEKAYMQLAFNRRHRGLNLITTVQSYKNLPVGLRTSASHLVLFRPSNQKEVISVWEEVLGPIPKQELNRFFEWVFAKKYAFLFVDMSLTLSNKFIFYKNWERILNI